MPFSQAILDALSLIRRRRRLVLSLFLVLFGLAAALILAAPPRYAARTTLLAKFGREYAFKTDAGGVLVPSNFGQDEIVNSVIEIMKSDAVLDATVASVGASRLFPELAETLPAGVSLEDAAAARLGQSLAIAPSRRTNVIGVELYSFDPRMAAEGLNAYVDAFKTKYLALYGENRTAFMEAEEARARKELQDAQDAASSFEREHKAYSKDGQAESLSRRKVDLDTQLARVVACCSGTPSAIDLARQVSEIDARIASLNADQTTLAAMVRRRELAQEALDAASRRVTEARTSRNMDESRMTSVEVIDRATPPVRPTRPGRMVKLFLAFVLVGTASLAAAFLAEVFSRRFSTASQVRRAFAVPVLADVPRWKPGKAI